MTSQDRRRIRLATTYCYLVRLLTFSIHWQKHAVSEYYDTSDPFIDDSELAIDEHQFFAQTKQQGFYVSSGEVALLKDKYVQSGLVLSLDLTYRTSKKLKSKKISFVAGLQKSLHTERNNKYSRNQSLSTLPPTQMRNGSKWRISLSR